MTLLEIIEHQKEFIKNTNNRRWFLQILTATLLALLPLIYFLPAVLGKVTLATSDGWRETFGIRILIGEMLKNGQLPLWNTYIFAGMPLLAGIETGALYPPTWFFAILSPQVAMNLIVITTYHLALIGTYLYARRIGISRLGDRTSGPYQYHCGSRLVALDFAGDRGIVSEDAMALGDTRRNLPRTSNFRGRTANGLL
jgi:hypothetical protein